MKYYNFSPKTFLNTSLLVALILLQSQVSKQKKSPAELNQILGSNTSAKSIADQVVADDMIVQGSICVGFDCVNNENFGADTERLKENNLRIHFDDTSATGSFPSNDWRIVANDQANGGSSYLAFEDATAGTQPFRVAAGAGANALHVISGGNVGLGTSSPVLELHIADGDSPALRMEQNASAGFAAQTWDIAGNETNFFVRDVTNGSKLPFKIGPNSPTNSIFIKSGSVELRSASLLDVHSPFDMDLNKEVYALNDATAVIQQLKPVSFKYREEYIKSLGLPEGKQFGISTSDLEKLMPSLVKEQTIGNSDKNYKYLNYQALVPILVRAIQEQQDIIDNQEIRINQLEDISAKISGLEKQLQQLEQKASSNSVYSLSRN